MGDDIINIETRVKALEDAIEALQLQHATVISKTCDHVWSYGLSWTQCSKCKLFCDCRLSRSKDNPQVCVCDHCQRKCFA